MYPYALLVTAFFFFKLIDFSLTKKKYQPTHPTQNNAIIAFSLILLFMSAFRHGVGWDYYAYYWTILLDLETNITSRGELITESIVKLAHTNSEPLIYFIINSSICLILITKTIKDYSEDQWMSIFLFTCFPLFFLNSLSVVRFFSALAIVFFAARYIAKGSIIKYLICILVASMLHSSAVIGIAMYFLSRVNLTPVRIFILALISTSLSTAANFYASSYFPQYAVYTEKTTTQEGTLAIYFFAALLLGCTIFHKQITKTHESKIHFNCFVFGFLIYLAFYGQGTMSHRLSLYGTIFSLLIFPKLINTAFRQTNTYIKTIIYISLTAIFFYSIDVGKETYIPYRTIFEKY